MPARKLQYLIAGQNKLGHEVHDPLNGRHRDPDRVRRLILAGCLLGFLPLLLTVRGLSRLWLLRLWRNIGRFIGLG